MSNRLNESQRELVRAILSSVAEALKSKQEFDESLVYDYASDIAFSVCSSLDSFEGEVAEFGKVMLGDGAGDSVFRDGLFLHEFVYGEADEVLLSD